MSEINTQDSIQELKEMLEQTQLTEGEIIQLTKKVLESGTEESKFILKLDEFKNYCYDGAIYRREFHLIYGDAKIIKTYEHKDICTEDYEYIIIPLSRVVVIIEEWQVEGFFVVHVFTPKHGWKSLTV